MPCNVSVPMQEIINTVEEALSEVFVRQDEPTINDGSFTDTMLNGTLTFDDTAKADLCRAVTKCILDHINTKNAEQNADLQVQFDNLGLRIDTVITKHDRENATLSRKIAGNATTIESIATTTDARMDDIENDYKAADAELEDALRRELKIVSVEREGGDVTITLADGSEFQFSILPPYFDEGRPVKFEVRDHQIVIELEDGTILDITHKQLSDWLAKYPGAMATDKELQDVYDALDADKVSKDELCELAEPCIQDMLDKLPPEKFISEHTVDGNKLISTYNTGGTIEVELQSSGLDCEAISELDEKGWEDGTTLLAQSGDGECYRLGNIESLFHDVGIGIGYSTSRQEVDKDVVFTYTVTNTGNNKVEAVDLAIVIPTETTDYSFEIESVTPNGVDSYETIDDLNYKILGIASGATFKVRAIVTGSEAGTYQTSAQATTSSPFEMNVENNVATAIVNFYDSKSNYIPTIDCPLIIATDVASGTELNTFGLGMQNVKETLGRANVYMTGESLAGKKIKLEGASTIISNCTVLSDEKVLTNRDSNLSNRGGDITNLHISESDISTQTHVYSEAAGRLLVDYVLTRKRVTSDTLASPDGDGLVTFDQATQIATFADNPEIRAAVIFMRPDGEDCRWQAIYLVSTNSIPVDPSCRNVTRVSGNATISGKYKTAGLNPDASYYQSYPTNKFIGGTDPEDWIVTAEGGIKSILGKKQAVISHTAGTESVLKMVDTCGDAKNYASSGAVSTTWDEDTNTLTITISASAKATDSQEWAFLKIDII